jgi:hypothetical protein
MLYIVSILLCSAVAPFTDLQVERMGFKDWTAGDANDQRVSRAASAARSSKRARPSRLGIATDIYT